MKKVITSLLAITILLNSFFIQLGNAEEYVVNFSESNENIIIENGTTKVCGTTNPYWMADTKESVLGNFISYTVYATLDKATTDVTADDIANNSQIIGNPVSSGDTAFIGANGDGKNAVLKAPMNASIKRFKCYIKSTGDKSAEIKEAISVAAEEDGPYTPVSVSVKKLGYVSGFPTNHLLFEVETTEEINCNYVKITLPSSGYTRLGAFEYDYEKIIDLSKLPDGTNKVCGTTNPYWMADTKDDVLGNFISYTVRTSLDTASTAVTAEEIASNSQIVGNPVNVGDTAFIGAYGDGESAVFKAPSNTFIRRFKCYIKSTGDKSAEIKEAISVAAEENGPYTPVSVSVKKLGYVSGFPTNHLLFEVETTAEINCSYVKITLPSSGYTRLGAFEYDYKINKAGLALDSVFYTVDEITNGQDRLHIENDLNLYETIELEDGTVYDIEWSSSSPDSVESDGRVTQGVRSKDITLVAKIYSDGALIYFKSYELTIAPIASELVMKEEFDTAEIDETTNKATLNGYNGWSAVFTEKTDSAIVASSLDVANKYLWVYREGYTDSNKHELTKSFDPISSGKAELSFKHMADPISGWARILFAGMDLYISSKAIRWYGSPGGTVNFDGQKSATWKLGEWHTYRFILDVDKNTLSVYFNDDILFENHQLPEKDYSMDFITLSSKRDSNFGANYFDDICVRDLTPESSEVVNWDSQLLYVPENVKEDIDLPITGVFGSAITWLSSEPNVINHNGIVEQDEVDRTVTLHATIVNGECMDERDFTVTVCSSTNEVEIDRSLTTLEKITDKFSIGKMLQGQSEFNITDNILLPTEYNQGDAGRLGGCNISWSSDNNAISIVNDTGIVNRTENDVKVTLTALFSFKEDSNISYEKQYTIFVAGEGSYEYFNKFDGVEFGKPASNISGIEVNEASGSGASYGAWQNPSDMLDGVMLVSRANNSSIDSDAIVQTDISGQIVDVGISFYLENSSDKINININGIDMPVVIKCSELSVDGEKYSVAIEHKKWHKLNIKYNDYFKFYNIYLDGEIINTTDLLYTNELVISSILISNDNIDGSVGSWYVDDLYVKDTNISDEDSIQRTINSLVLEDTAEWNIILPTQGQYGANIVWRSETPTILSNEGIVYRKVGEDKIAKLVATISRGGVSESICFDIKVPGLSGTELPTQEKFEEHVDDISIYSFTEEKPYYVTKDISLFLEYIEGNSAFYGGMDVEWESEYQDIISNEGKVTQPMFDKGVTLTATYTSKRDPSITTQREYVFIVRAIGETVMYEDFETLSREDIGQTPVIWNWDLEEQPEHLSGQIIDFAIDPADTFAPFEKANKALRINRYKLTENTQRTYRNFSQEESNALNKAEAFAFSFRLKFMTTQSRLDFQIGGLSFNVRPNGLGGGISDRFNETLSTEEWHDFTFIICPKNYLVYYMVDGKTDVLPNSYYIVQKKPSFNYLLLDTFRTSAVGEIYVDDLCFRVLGEDDSVAVEDALSNLSIPNEIQEDFVLPVCGTNRTSIRWISYNPEVILDTGKIVGSGNAHLKAIIKRGASTATKDFNVTVRKLNDNEFHVSDIVCDGNIISGVTLSKLSGFEDAEFIFLVYNKGKLVQMRSSQLNGTVVSFEEIDISQYFDCEIKAYVSKNNRIVSNVFSKRLT